MDSSLSIDVFNSGYQPVPGGPGWDDSVAVWIGLDEGLQPEDLAIESLVGGAESDAQHEIAVNVATIREALGSGLFLSRGLGRQGWQHQTYAEYLAAFYLKAHDVSSDTLRSLLLHPDGSGKVIPQLRELAVWLSAMNRQTLDASSNRSRSPVAKRYSGCE